MIFFDSLSLLLEYSLTVWSGITGYTFQTLSTIFMAKTFLAETDIHNTHWWQQV
jgi:hypothetical protein